MIAKLRVGCSFADCAPGVRTIVRRVLFHWMTSFADPADVSAPAAVAPTIEVTHISAKVLQRGNMKISLLAIVAPLGRRAPRRVQVERLRPVGDYSHAAVPTGIASPPAPAAHACARCPSDSLTVPHRFSPRDDRGSRRQWHWRHRPEPPHVQPSALRCVWPLLYSSRSIRAGSCATHSRHAVETLFREHPVATPGR